MLFLVLIILLIPSFASAALSPAEFAQAMGNSDRYQAALTKTHNLLTSEIIVGQTYSHYQQGWFVSNGVEILQPLSMPAATARAALPTATRVSGSRVLLKRAGALLGPVGTAVAIGFTAKDLYDLVKGSPSDYPALSSALVQPGFLSASDNVTSPQQYADGTVVTGIPGMPFGQYATIQYKKMTMTNVSGGCYPGLSGYDSIVLWDSISGNYASTCGNGNTPKNGNATIYKVVFTNTAPAPITQTEDQFVSEVAPNDVVDAPYTTEFDQATKALSDSGKSAMQPSSDQIKELANTVQQDAAVDAAQTAVDSAQDNYDSNPTAESLQALNEAKAALEAQKAAAARENVVAPPVPDSGNYDSGIELPEKKSILSLLQSFASGSPIVSMLNSFTMSASGSGFVHLGDAFGKSIDVDFTRYESVLAGCGGVLLILVHGFAVLVVVRGW